MHGGGTPDTVDGSSNFPFQRALGGSHLFIADDNNSRVVSATMLNNISLTAANLNLAGVMFPSYDGVAAGDGMAYISVNGLLGIFDVSDPVACASTCDS